MGFAALEKRIRALEQAFAATGDQCNCRTGQHTAYHSAAELKKLMAIRCPAHGFRDLGYMRWLPARLPLRAEDQTFCSCPPCSVREFLLGRRGPLTEEEQKGVEHMWEEEFGADQAEAFRREQARLEPLLRKYEYNKRNARRVNG